MTLTPEQREFVTQAIDRGDIYFFRGADPGAYFLAFRGEPDTDPHDDEAIPVYCEDPTGF